MVFKIVIEIYFCVFFFQAEDGIRDVERSRGLGDVIRDRTTGVSSHSFLLLTDTQ